MIRLFVSFLAAIFLGLTDLSASDRHSGYYYPIPKNIENYKSRVRVSVKTDRSVRLKTLEKLRKNFRDRLFPSQFLLHVKGKLSDKIIFIGIDKGFLNTKFRVRALLESMNVSVRNAAEFNNVKTDKSYSHNTLQRFDS